MNAPSSVRWATLVFSAIAVATFLRAEAAANESPCAAEVRCATYVRTPAQPSWIFRRGPYTHDPYTGARVAQYMRTPPVEPLDDERLVTSRYRRSRTNLRGAEGSLDTYYEVQAWGNGRGGLDAEWERFHDAWKESYLTGGYYNQAPGYQGPWGNGGGHYGGGYGGSGHGYGFPGSGYGGPGYGPGGPGYGNPPGYGMPPYGYGGHGYTPHGNADHHNTDGHEED